MPTKPATFRPNAGQGSDAERRASVQAYDRRRREESATRPLYGTARWQKKRARQLRLEPLCRMCAAEGIVCAANIADHVEPHRGDVDKFWNGELQSLCGPHHNAAKQAEERAARSDREGVSKVRCRGL